MQRWRAGRSVRVALQSARCCCWHLIDFVGRREACQRSGSQAFVASGSGTLQSAAFVACVCVAFPRRFLVVVDLFASRCRRSSRKPVVEFVSADDITPDVRSWFFAQFWTSVDAELRSSPASSASDISRKRYSKLFVSLDGMLTDGRTDGRTGKSRNAAH